MAASIWMKNSIEAHLADLGGSGQQAGGDGRFPVWDASISSMWAIGNFARLEDFFKVSARLGFAKIEMNYQVNSSMLAGIELTNYQFSSLHDPCPAELSPEELKGRDWLTSAVNDDCRQEGVAVVKRSIDLAHELGAPVVVIHAGNIGVSSTLEKELQNLYEAGRTQSQEYVDIKDRLIELRVSRAEPRLAAVEKSLRELVDYASRYEICLGLENRYHYLDIPSLEEMGSLLRLADADQLGFVYDAGHAHTLDQLGFTPHKEWFTRYASRIVGTHLHDAIGIEDHAAPGLGEIDFGMVAANLPDGAFRTCELRRSNTIEQVKAGIQYLVDKGCVKCR